MATSSLGSDLKVTLGPPGLAAQDSSGLDLRSLDGLPFGSHFCTYIPGETTIELIAPTSEVS